MDSAPLLCPNPNLPSPSQQAGSMSIWSYMTAAIVASTVASNMVNNVSTNYLCCLYDVKKVCMYVYVSSMVTVNSFGHDTFFDGFRSTATTTITTTTTIWTIKISTT